MAWDLFNISNCPNHQLYQYVSHTFAIDGVIRRVNVKSKVNARISQGLHALIVVFGVIDGVDADGVDA